MYTCEERDGADPRSAGYFLPIFVADLTQNGQSASFTEGRCFQQMTFTYNINYDATGAMETVVLTIDAKRPRSLFCRDWFFIGNTEVQHVETITESGSHTVTFTNLDEDT
jgi:hypothetical protein